MGDRSASGTEHREREEGRGGGMSLRGGSGGSSTGSHCRYQDDDENDDLSYH